MWQIQHNSSGPGNKKKNSLGIFGQHGQLFRNNYTNRQFWQYPSLWVYVKLLWSTTSSGQMYSHAESLVIIRGMENLGSEGCVCVCVKGGGGYWVILAWFSHIHLPTVLSCHIPLLWGGTNGHWLKCLCRHWTDLQPIRLLITETIQSRVCHTICYIPVNTPCSSNPPNMCMEGIWSNVKCLLVYVV